MTAPSFVLLQVDLTLKWKECSWKANCTQNTCPLCSPIAITVDLFPVISSHVPQVVEHLKEVPLHLNDGDSLFSNGRTRPAPQPFFAKRALPLA